MKSGSAVWILRILSYFLLVLALIPVLWPLVLPAGVALAAWGFWLARRRAGELPSISSLFQGRLFEKRIRNMFKRNKDGISFGDVPEDAALRSARRATFAVLINLGLLFILLSISWLGFILPLDRDLEPLRKESYEPIER
ncbi:MAG TPA: hypothetical protein DEA96_17115 [Leptospiraceae bacterium]|nr:hypothetical protein [Spirochaetaceae bacterium]HBS06692.1 hypothetical protein [Leptospiraceae bacterium]|tara:strand:+ start:11507 stop:11926 length:420 start_codon:yes stop_codon:yes gene_type:complete